MNKQVFFAFGVTALMMAGCAGNLKSDGPSSQASRDYESIGDSTNIFPFVYDHRTLLEVKHGLHIDRIEDDQGNLINYSMEGKYYSLDEEFNKFSVQAGGKTIKYHLVHSNRTSVQEPEKLPPLIDPDVVDMASNDNAPEVCVTETLPTDVVTLQTIPLGAAQPDAPIFKQMRIQLDQYQQLLRKAAYHEGVNGDQLDKLRKKLDGLETKYATGIAVVHVYFDEKDTRLPTKDPVMDDIVLAAHAVSRVNLYGRTSAFSAGRDDPKIASNRAGNMEKFLVDNGVPKAKIHVTSLPDNDFIVVNHLKEAARYNRRVAVEFIP